MVLDTVYVKKRKISKFRKLINVIFKLVQECNKFKDTNKNSHTDFIMKQIENDYLNLINSKFEMKNIKFINILLML